LTDCVFKIYHAALDVGIALKFPYHVLQQSAECAGIATDCQGEGLHMGRRNVWALPPAFAVFEPVFHLLDRKQLSKFCERPPRIFSVIRNLQASDKDNLPRQKVHHKRLEAGNGDSEPTALERGYRHRLKIE
jgi:hypothetical protein